MDSHQHRHVRHSAGVPRLGSRVRLRSECKTKLSACLITWGRTARPASMRLHRVHTWCLYSCSMPGPDLGTGDQRGHRTAPEEPLARVVTTLIIPSLLHSLSRQALTSPWCQVPCPGLQVQKRGIDCITLFSPAPGLRSEYCLSRVSAGSGWNRKGKNE